MCKLRAWLPVNTLRDYRILGSALLGMKVPMLPCTNNNGFAFYYIYSYNLDIINLGCKEYPKLERAKIVSSGYLYTIVGHPESFWLYIENKHQTSSDENGDTIKYSKLPHFNRQRRETLICNPASYTAWSQKLRRSRHRQWTRTSSRQGAVFCPHG